MAPRLALFESPRFCGLISSPADALGRAQRGVAVSCGNAPPTRLAVENDQLRIGSEVRALPPGVALELPKDVPSPAQAICDPAAPPHPSEIRVRRRLLAAGNAAADRGAVLELELDGKIHELGRFSSRPVHCGSSRIFAKSTKLQLGCIFEEMGFRVSLEIDGDRLLVEWLDTGFQQDVLRQRFGFTLPCNSSPRFHAFDVQDPAWKPSVGPCADRCRVQDGRCEDVCYQRFADAAGVLSAEGERCSGACVSAREGCVDRCLVRKP